MEPKKIYRALVGFDPDTLTPKLEMNGVYHLNENNYKRMRDNFDGKVVCDGKWLWIYAEVEV